MIEEFFSDAFFAAIAAIGFSAISNPPRKAYLFCALIAAAGHSIRFLLMSPGLMDMPIIPASAIASFVIGLLAVLLSPLARIPAETFLFPSLLPMIPGIYAYRAFGGLAMCLSIQPRQTFITFSISFQPTALCACSLSSEWLSAVHFRSSSLNGLLTGQQDNGIK